MNFCNADPMTAERSLGNPNSSSNYPAYEAASLDGIARSKRLSFDINSIFIEPMCTWGPIYGPSVSDSDTFCRLS